MQASTTASRETGVIDLHDAPRTPGSRLNATGPHRWSSPTHGQADLEPLRAPRTLRAWHAAWSPSSRCGALVVLSLGAAIVGVRGAPGAAPTTTSTTSPPPSASTTSTTTASASYPCGVVPSPEVVITSNTFLCSVTTPVGDTIHVVLNPGLRWSTPMSDSSAVVVENVQRQSTGGLDADLIAVRAGQATVTAMGTALCPPGGACPQFIVLWRLHVTVGT